MKTERESRLEILAYKIWEEQGRPEGRQEEHWAEAERRLRFDSSGGLALEGKTQDTPGRPNPSGSRQQTQPRQSNQTGSPDLDSKTASSKPGRQQRPGAAGGDSRPPDSKPDFQG